MKNYLSILFTLISFVSFSQKAVFVSVKNDSVCILDESPTGKPSSVDKASLWLRADKAGKIIYNCPNQLQQINAPSGVYKFDPDGDGQNIFDGYYDSTEGGGWLMILNYVRDTGNPGLNIRTNDLPLMGSLTLGAGEAGTAFWGHASNAMVAQFNVSEIRFYGVTSNHNRVIHFSTDESRPIDYIRSGTGNMYPIKSGHTPLSGHSAILPAGLTTCLSHKGNYALINNPFRSSGNSWAIRTGSGYWTVDDLGYYSSNHNTLHRVFIRTDSCDCPFGVVQSANPSDGTGVDFWQDMTSYSKNATQNSTANQPTYLNNSTDNINFNPSFSFTDNHLEIAAPGIFETGVTHNNISTFIVLADNERNNFDWVLFEGTDVDDRFSFSMNWRGGANMDWDKAGLINRLTYLAPTPNIPYITAAHSGTTSSYGNSFSNNQALEINGNLVDFNNSFSGYPGINSKFYIGDQESGGDNYNNPFGGRITELIIYKKELSSLEQRVIPSYLAIKYGITLSHDYISPDSVLLFDVSKGYNFGIIGIGKNTSQGLYQKKSKSESDSSAGITIELTTEISSGSYLICGHDNGSLTRINLAGETNVITRKYFSEQTGGVGTVNVELALSEIGANTGLATNQVKIIIADNSSFTNPFVLEATTVSGGIAYFSGVPLNDKYFTFKAAP